MKESKYNIIFEHNSKKLAFNSLTCVLAEVDDKFFYMLKKATSMNFDKNSLDEEQTCLLKNLENNGFLINDDFDELNFLEYEFNKKKYRNGSAIVTILPTTACNCCCPYCFEGENKKLDFISDRVKHAIYRQLKLLTIGKKNLQITWFGGEPLLAKSDIWDMSKKIILMCKERYIEYHSSIITNGYLIDKQTIQNMLDSHIESVQITLDGSPAIHDSIRKLHNGKGTFFKIVDNVKLMLKMGISVGVSVHVDYMEKNDMIELFDIFEKENFKKCYISVGTLSAYNGNCKIHSPLTDKKAAEKIKMFKKLIMERRFNKLIFEDYPSTEETTCMANNINSFIVSPLGDLYNCLPEVGELENSVGNVLEIKDIREIINSHKIKYMLWSPFKYKKCRNCDILPICMGGCVNKGVKEKMPVCITSKNNVLEKLRLTYDKKIKN